MIVSLRIIKGLSMNVAACLLVEGHALLREGLSLLISQAWPHVKMQGVGSLSQAREVLSGHPGVSLVLLNLSLPDSRGIDTLRRLRGLAPAVPVILISADECARTVVEAAEAGACGYVPRAADWRVLKPMLAEVLQAPVMPMPSGSARAREPLGLTSRQMAVLRLLAEGKSNKAIGRELDMAPSTVKTHLEGIFARLGVNTRTQAVVEAARLGLAFGPQSFSPA